MKQLGTLVTLLVIFFTTAKAQYSENFDNEAALSIGCWELNNTIQASLGLNNGMQMSLDLSSTTYFATPYIEPNSNQITISFTYRLTSVLPLSSAPVLEVSIGETSSTIYLSNTTTNTTVNVTATLANSYDWQRIIFKLTGSLTSNVVIDNINVIGLNNKYSCSPPPNKVMPIKILDFTCKKYKGKAELNWSVLENETGNHFEVEKSMDAKNFSLAAVIFNTEKYDFEKYTYNERFGGNTYYRLKIVNNDGKIDYTKTILLKEDHKNSTDLKVLQHPRQGVLIFTYNSITSGAGNVSLYNSAGIKVFSASTKFRIGLNEINFNLGSTIKPGVYFLHVIGNTSHSSATVIN